MSTNNPPRRRSKHVASLELAPSQFVRFLHLMRRPDILLRILLCFTATAIMWAATGAWAPPFPYRSRDVPARDVVARVGFEKPDEELKRQKKEEARRNLECVYNHDQQALERLRETLRAKFIEFVSAESAKDVPDSLWVELWPDMEEIPDAEHEEVREEIAGAEPDESQVEIPDTEREEALAERFQIVQDAFAEDTGLEKLGLTLAAAFTEIDQDGVLDDTLGHDEQDGSLTRITVWPASDPEQEHPVLVDDVRLERVKSVLAERIQSKLPQVIEQEEARAVVAEAIIGWVDRNLRPTLTFDDAATVEKRELKLSQIGEVTVEVPAGSMLAERGVSLTPNGVSFNNLRLEHDAYVKSLGWSGVVRCSLATLGMYVAMYTLCGFYIHYRRPQLLSDLRQLATLLGTVTVSVVLAKLAARDGFRAEMIPLLLLGMATTIAYKQELALLVSAATALVVVLSLGQSLVEFVILLSAVATAILFLSDVRSRTKLIYVGLMAGAVAMLTTLGVGTFGGQPPMVLLSLALWFGGCSLLAGLLMTGMLPFIERIFQVQTDISLLELGDAAHPLLQELVRRAPGTYNHSINVASISEAAADAIGAKGLLVRVGAYFHDIGKMFKPEYFVENQGLERNRHDTLLPAMSTLVIIAHVKDGADLARQHNLPQAIIDFIQQHHGTTLVEYFYRQASKQSEDDPDAGAVDETSFRYPGPKPQTKEAGVLMLADAVESASRALVDPTPSRIESLVHELAMKRLLDGQFDACGLTLQELRIMETSLIKSLTAVYHGRVKYPGQEQRA